jgi:predicted transcriptional regulator
MDILEMVRADLKGASMARQNEVADACGIPWATLRKIIDGDTADPRYSTVERLRAYYLSPRERAAPQQATGS